jgi:hypothetical protein
VATLKVAPVEARRRSLPVRCEIRVRLDDRTVQSLICPPGRRDGAFHDLPVHLVYAVTISPDKFQMSGRAVPVDADEELVAILCLLDPRHAEPELPNFARLPPDLQRVLNDSPALDRTLSERQPATRTADERSLEIRALGRDRELDQRPLEETRQGVSRWERLGPEQKAGLLNLYSKMKSVMLEGESVWSHVESFDDVQRDRVHINVDAHLRSQVTKVPCFGVAPGLLHRPKEGYTREKSFKTDEPFGNLQLTFFVPDGQTTPTFVDADVDDAGGIEHAVEQVPRNFIRNQLRKVLGDIVPEGKTHPFDIHQLLIHHQRGSDAACRNIIRYEPLYLLKLRDALDPFAI